MEGVLGSYLGQTLGILMLGTIVGTIVTLFFRTRVPLDLPPTTLPHPALPPIKAEELGRFLRFWNALEEGRGEQIEMRDAWYLYREGAAMET